MNRSWWFIVHRSSFIVLLAICCAKPEEAPRTVERIVSLAPNVTEMIFAAGCGGKVVGTDNFSDYPDAVKRLPKVGGVEPDVEKIASLHADLVIASSSNVHPNLRRAIASIHVPLLVVETNRLSEIGPGVATIQQQAGCNAIVTVTAALEQQRRKRTKSPRVMFVVWPDPLYAAGRSTYVDDLFVLTGARNAVDSSGWPQLSLETFATHPPDLLLYPSGSVMPSAIDDLMARAHVKIEAVAVDANVFSRPGPRVVIAAEVLNRILDQWERSH